MLWLRPLVASVLPRGVQKLWYLHCGVVHVHTAFLYQQGGAYKVFSSSGTQSGDNFDPQIRLTWVGN